MSHRLTIQEFEFLKRSLRALEAIGQKMLFGEKPNEPVVDFFKVGKAAINERVESLQLLIKKIELIAGE